MRQRNSSWGLLGLNVDVGKDKVVKTVRLAMLLAVEEHCGSQAHYLDQRINAASDLAALWSLRPNLVNEISDYRSEAFARDYAARITLLFNGYQPA